MTMSMCVDVFRLKLKNTKGFERDQNKQYICTHIFEAFFALCIGNIEAHCLKLIKIDFHCASRNCICCQMKFETTAAGTITTTTKNCTFEMKINEWNIRINAGRMRNCVMYSQVLKCNLKTFLIDLRQNETYEGETEEKKIARNFHIQSNL